MELLLASGATNKIDVPGLELVIAIELEVLTFTKCLIAGSTLLTAGFLNWPFIHEFALLDLVDVHHAESADPGTNRDAVYLDALDVEGILASITKDHIGLVVLL